MTDARNDLPSDKASNFSQRVRETLMTYMGRQGNPLDRGITIRDLVAAGVLKIKDGVSLTTGRGAPPIGLGNDVDNSNVAVAPSAVYVPDLTPPPTPTGFVATAAISNIVIETDAALYTQGHGNMSTVIYGAIYTTGPLPTFADSQEITSFNGSIGSYATNPSTTWHLWAKWKTNDGVLSTDPAGGTNGIVAVTGQDVTKLVAAMTGPGNPFTILPTTTIIDGVTFPAGTYSTQAFIQDAEITNAKIANLAVDDAKIASVSAAKITAGTIGVGEYIQSQGYVAGTSGWEINSDGTAEFGVASIRGQITAEMIDSRGLTIRDTLGNAILTAGSSVAASSFNLPGIVDNVPSGWLNSNVSIGSDGTLSGGGGGQVTIGGLGYTGAMDATKNAIYRQTTAPTGGTYTTGDLWIDTDSVPTTVSQWTGSAWSVFGNYTTNTTQLTDGAGLGTKANYSNLVGTPSSAIANSSITLSSNGTLNGAGGGQITAAGIGAATASDLTNKLNKSGADTMTGPISLNAATAILVGSTYNGLYLGNTGIVGRKYGQTTFSVDQYGNATFKGDITGASGTFSGSLSGANISGATGTFTGSITGASGSFGGSLNAATGTFSGSLTASAINAVNTINIANNSVTASNSVTGSAATISTTLYIPANITANVSAFLFTKDSTNYTTVSIYDTVTANQTINIDGVTSSVTGSYHSGLNEYTDRVYMKETYNLLQRSVSGGASGRSITVSATTGLLGSFQFITVKNLIAFALFK